MRFLQKKKKGHCDLYSVNSSMIVVRFRLLEHGMDIKTLSSIIGHVSSATTLDIYSHITMEMEIKAVKKIDEGVAKQYTTIKEDTVSLPENVSVTSLSRMVLLLNLMKARSEIAEPSAFIRLMIIYSPLET